MTSRFISHTALGAMFFLLALPIVARAQFNGPGLLPGQELNRPVAPTTDQALLYPAEHDLVLGPQDLITIHLFNEAEYAPVVRIGTDGTVQLPLIGNVALAGLSISAAERLIEHKLEAAGMYNNPQVTIQITEGPNAVITLVGETHGVIPVTGTRRLYDVIAAAGGLPATASHVVTINRPGVAEPIVVDLGTDPSRSALADIPVFAGDTIVVSRAGVVYVVGAFKSQGVIPLTQNQPLTLLEATALSGGTAFEAKYGDMRIIRTVGNSRTVVKLNIQNVLYGRAPDPILQPNDILFLPSSAIKASLTNGTLGTFLGISGLLISVIAYR